MLPVIAFVVKCAHHKTANTNWFESQTDRWKDKCRQSEYIEAPHQEVGASYIHENRDCGGY